MPQDAVRLALLGEEAETRKEVGIFGRPTAKTGLVSWLTTVDQAIMPLGSAFFNYLVPLQIGARDVAFPRLNGFAYWVFLAGGIIVNAGWFVRSGAPDVGWFGFAPLTSNTFSNSFEGDVSTDLWIMGIQVLGVSSIIGALNFVVTIINLRAPA